MGREGHWIIRFLDRECVRRLAQNTLRSYAMDLPHFRRWRDSRNHAGASHLDKIQLTSVSIALANVNIRRKARLEFDLSYWIK